MPRYTMRLTWPNEDRPNDYVSRVDGRDAGRCYEAGAVGGGKHWVWTVYQGRPRGMQYAATLAEAQRKFKAAFERALVKLPGP